MTGVMIGLLLGIELNIVGDLITFPIDSLIFICYLSAFTTGASLIVISVVVSVFFLVFRTKIP